MAFPTTGILDSGVGTDEDPIAGNWSGPTFTGEIQLRRFSNQITRQVGASNGASNWNASIFGPSCEVFATVATKPADGGPTLDIEARLFPMAGAPNGYILRLVPSVGGDIFRIRRLDAGSTVALGADIVQDISPGDAIGLECIWDQISAYWKPAAGGWTLLGTRTDATYIQAGRIGISMTTTVPQITNFGGGNIPAESRDNFSIGVLGRGAGW